MRHHTQGFSDCKIKAFIQSRKNGTCNNFCPPPSDRGVVFLTSKPRAQKFKRQVAWTWRVRWSNKCGFALVCGRSGKQSDSKRTNKIQDSQRNTRIVHGPLPTYRQREERPLISPLLSKGGDQAQRRRPEDLSTIQHGRQGKDRAIRKAKKDTPICNRSREFARKANTYQFRFID